eukprot:gene10449-2971_t
MKKFLTFSMKRYYSNGATKEGTINFFNKFNHIEFKGLSNKVNWNISPIGYSGYSLNLSEPEHQFSLQYAIQGGCNIIDTSPNYSDGESEHLIGIVVNGMIKDEIIKRNEVIISTKVGFYNSNEGEEDEIIKKYKMKQISSNTYHSLSLEYISYSIKESLKRLNVSCIDILFLQLNEENDENLNEIFNFLENEIKNERIQYYGISFNKYNYSKISKIISNVQKDHFKFLQLPFNLIENESLNDLEKFKEKGFNILTNRPFYSSNETIPILKLNLDEEFNENNLNEENENFNEFLEEFKKVTKEALEVELNFDQFSKNYSTNELPLTSNFQWIQILNSNLNKIKNISMFKNILEFEVHPKLNDTYYKLCDLKDEKFLSWFSTYRFYLNQYFSVLMKLFEKKHLIEMIELNLKLNKSNKKFEEIKGGLTNKLIHYYTSIKEIDTILIGMNKKKYVKDIILNLKNDKLSNNEIKNISKDFYQEIKFINQFKE